MQASNSGAICVEGSQGASRIFLEVHNGSKTSNLFVQREVLKQPDRQASIKIWELYVKNNQKEQARFY